MTHPLAVTNCNIDMEGLISDQVGGELDSITASAQSSVSLVTQSRLRPCYQTCAPLPLYSAHPPSPSCAQNRSIATLAITTLLKTGSESSVEKLLKQVGCVCVQGFN